MLRSVDFATKIRFSMRNLKIFNLGKHEKSIECCGVCSFPKQLLNLCEKIIHGRKINIQRRTILGHLTNTQIDIIMMFGTVFIIFETFLYYVFFHHLEFTKNTGS